MPQRYWEKIEIMEKLTAEMKVECSNGKHVCGQNGWLACGVRTFGRSMNMTDGRGGVVVLHRECQRKRLLHGRKADTISHTNQVKYFGVVLCTQPL